MVGSDVHQYGNVGLEVIHVVELEAAELYHIVVVVILCHLQRKALAYIAC